MPTPEETMAFNNQEAFGNAVNTGVDTAQQMLDAASQLHEIFGMETKRGSKGPLDRIKQLQALRNFVTIKEPTSGFDPQMQLQAIDAEIARLQAAQKPSKPLVQSAEDNQRGR